MNEIKFLAITSVTIRFSFLKIVKLKFKIFLLEMADSSPEEVVHCPKKRYLRKMEKARPQYMEKLLGGILEDKKDCPSTSRKLELNFFIMMSTFIFIIL